MKYKFLMMLTLLLLLVGCTLEESSKEPVVEQERTARTERTKRTTRTTRTARTARTASRTSRNNCNTYKTKCRNGRPLYRCGTGRFHSYSVT